MLTDLTNGSPTKIIFKFSLPILLSSMFQQFYGIANLIIAGKLIGIDALASIGASIPITLIFIAIAQGCNIGSSVTISQIFGSKDFLKMKTAIYTSLSGILVLSLILTLTGFIFSKPMLIAMNTPTEVFDWAVIYLNIHIGGLVFLFLYNICNGICTALGDSKTPLVFLIASSIGNIILDLILIGIFHMGIDGVAWATFICQGICSLLAFGVLLHRIKKIETKEKPKIYSSEMMIRISKIAIPSILQQSFVSVGNLFVQGIVNGFGPEVIAGFSAASRINVFALSATASIGNGLASFTAQNIGAGKPERVAAGYKSAMMMMVVIVILFTTLYLIMAKDLVGLFVDKSTENVGEAINAGALFLTIVSPFYIVVSAKLIADGVLRGTGSMLFFMIATFSDLIIRVVMAYALVPFFGKEGICFSWNIGWVVGFVFSIYFCHRIIKYRINRNF